MNDPNDITTNQNQELEMPNTSQPNTIISLDEQSEKQIVDQIQAQLKQDISRALIFQKMSHNIDEKHGKADNERATQSYNLYVKLTYLRKICCALLLIMSFFQRPSWCSPESFNDRCDIEYSDPNTYIPTWGLPYLDIYLYSILEFVIVLFLLINKAIKINYFSFQAKRFQRFLILLLLTIVLLAGNIFTIATNNKHNFCADMFVKPIFFVVYKYSIYTIIKSTFEKILIEAKAIFSLMFMNIILFALIARLSFGCILYNKLDLPLGTPESQNAFRSMAACIYNLFVLQTTTNFPDIMMPFFIYNRFTFFFFMVFLLVNGIIITNMLLGVFFIHYKKQVENKTMKVLTSHTLKRNEAQIISQQIIKKNQQQIIKKTIKSQNTQSQNQLESSGHTHHIQGFTEFQKKLFNFMHLKSFITFMEVLSISSFCEIFVADYDDVSYYFLVFDIISNFVFLSEELAIIYLVGINSYVRRPYNLFQLAISLVIIGLLITSIITWLKIYIRIMQALVFFRVMRIMKIILKTDHLKFFFMTFYKFLPNFFDCLGVLCMIFYFFIALGEHLFGGEVNTSTISNLQAKNIPESFIYNNFNDFYHGFVLAFELLVVTNWNIITEIHSIFKYGAYYLVFFVAFYIISVLLVLNIIIASLIDYMVNNLEESHAQDAEVRDSLNSLEVRDSLNSLEVNSVINITLEQDDGL